MSFLKKITKTKKRALRFNEAVIIENQDQFNRLSSFFDSLDEDSIFIDGIYVAYMDEYPALQVEPITNFAEDIDSFLEACEHKNLKPIDFDKWYRRNK